MKFRDKHYLGQDHVPRYERYEVRSVRLSESDLLLLRRLFPGDNLSFAIRSCIHAYDRLLKEQND